MSRKSPFSEEIEKMLNKKEKNVSNEKSSKMSFNFKDLNVKQLGIGITIFLFVFLLIFRKRYLYDKEKKKYSLSKIIIYLILGLIPIIISFYV